MDFTTAAVGRIGWWRGASGAEWITSAYPIDRFFMTGPGVYVLAKMDLSGRCHALYVGQTDDLDRRMYEHMRGKLPLAQLLGANEIHVHLLAKTRAERFEIETDLRRRLSPTLNLQSNDRSHGGLFGLGIGR